MSGVYGVAKLEWEGIKAITATIAVVKAANKDGAKAVLQKAKAIRATDLHNISGDLDRALRVLPSKFSKTDFIIGVFDNTPYEEWEDTLGARGIFVEFGHAAPHMGRKKGRSRKDIVKTVPPHPFLRPALDASGGDIRSSYHKHKLP